MQKVMPREERIQFSGAVRGGDLKKVVDFIKKYPDLAVHPAMGDAGGTTWLHVAAGAGQLRICQKLIEHGADVNAIDSSRGSQKQRSVLREAVSGDHVATLKMLLESGATIDPDDKWLVISAIANDHEDSLGLVKLLAAHGADLHLVIPGELTAHGKPLNALTTALDWDRSDVVKYLKSKGCVMPEETLAANPMKKQPKPELPHARTRKPSATSKILPKNERHELYSAISNGDCKKFVAFNRKYPDMARHPFMGDPGGTTWLHVAAGAGQLKICQMLIEQGADVNAIDSSRGSHTKYSVLREAVSSDHATTAKMLLESGAVIDPNDLWLVIGAIANDHEDSLGLVKLLAAHGADLHLVIPGELTAHGKPLNALTTALDWDRSDVVKYLKSKGCVMPEETLAASPVKKKPNPVAETKKAPSAPTFAQETVAFCEQNFGPVDSKSLTEIVASSDPPISIRVIRPSKTRPYVTLFTTGMSHRAMKVPKGGEDFRFAELFIQLPADWPVERSRLKETPSATWPFKWLWKIAAYPHAHKTWLGGAATIIANDAPPQPLAKGLTFTSILALAEKEFTRTNGDHVRLYRILPLYSEERELELRKGIGALMNALDDNRVPFVVDLKRKNVGKV